MTDLIPPDSLFVCGQMGAHVTRVRLAEPEPPLGQATTDIGVPVYVVKKAEPVQDTAFDRWWDNALDGPTPVAPVSKKTARWIWDAAKAEPVQEPVAYSEGRTLHWHEGKGVSDAQLFAAPPQRKPLTDEELRSMCKQTWVFETVKQWCRVIERAHGIGGTNAKV